MKFYLNTGIIKFFLNPLGLRFGLRGITPDIIPPVTCEVTWTDDTCLTWDDNTFAEYD